MESAAPRRTKGEMVWISFVLVWYSLLSAGLSSIPSGYPLAYPKLASLPREVVRVLEPALARDPAQRPDARQFRAMLYELQGR
jgi:hypothetical protein